MKGPIFPAGELLSYVETSASGKRFRSEEQMIYHMLFLLWGAEEDTAYIVFLNRQKSIVGSLQITEGALHRNNVFRKGDEMAGKGAVSFFMGHTHCGKPLEPSLEDRLTTRNLQEYFAGKMKCLFHLITNSGAAYTIIKP